MKPARVYRKTCHFYFYYNKTIFAEDLVSFSSCNFKKTAKKNVQTEIGKFLPNKIYIKNKKLSRKQYRKRNIELHFIVCDFI